MTVSNKISKHQYRKYWKADIEIESLILTMLKYWYWKYRSSKPYETINPQIPYQPSTIVLSHWIVAALVQAAGINTCLGKQSLILPPDRLRDGLMNISKNDETGFWVQNELWPVGKGKVLSCGSKCLYVWDCATFYIII